MRSRLTAAIVAALGALALLPSGAGASTIAISSGDIEYAAAAGETNNLTVEIIGSNYVLTDAPGITITPDGSVLSRPQPGVLPGRSCRFHRCEPG